MSGRPAARIRQPRRRKPRAATPSSLPDSLQRAIRATVPGVLAELRKPGHGALGRWVAQLPALRGEARALAEEMPWQTISSADLRTLYAQYTQLLIDIWEVFGPEVRGAPTPAAHGDSARALFMWSLVLRAAASEDPLTRPFVIYQLAEFGTRAAAELERRLDGADVGKVASLALSLRIPDDANDPSWARLEQVMPGLDRRGLAGNKAEALRSLDMVADEVRAQLAPKHRKPLAREEFSPGKSLQQILHQACARVIVETLGALTTDSLVTQALRRRLIDTIADRVRREIQAAEQERRRYRGASDEAQLDREVRKAQQNGRLAKTPPEQEAFTVSVEQEDDARAGRRVGSELDRLIREFLKIPKYRKHRDGMRLLLSNTRGQGKALARQRGITEAAVTHRHQQALRDFVRWVRHRIGPQADS